MFDVTDLADAVVQAARPDEAWLALSRQLEGHGLKRTALHTRLPLSAANPFGHADTGPVFGEAWDAAYDRRLRGYDGDLRRAQEADLRHMRPTLMFLSVSRAPLFIDHRKVVANRRETAFKPLCRTMIEEVGQYQAAAFPLLDPTTGEAAILSAWGDENRSDFSDFVLAHLQVLHLAGHFFMGMLGVKWPNYGNKVTSETLSDRERQVLSHLAKGMTTATVADHLEISDRSVTEYILRARHKLGARTRAEAIARATILGQID
ncbi:LuxR C-terminal-related transcriptional regulator [Amorphus sp. 3PC139-8]|uniref:helix-turn-helix transcriptional regulator n=1 Tax=Amorphus sp. 3PC139-8 TaxID=2735676 RepID=UPI00345CB18D